MRKRVWVLSIIVLVMARPVWSDLLVEPFIGYSMGEAEGGGAKEDHSGVLYGGKLGYKMLGLSAGLRYDMGGIDASWNDGDQGRAPYDGTEIPSENPFSGFVPLPGLDNASFDGKGHTISNLYIHSQVTQIGLFSSLNTNSSVKSLHLKSIRIHDAKTVQVVREEVGRRPRYFTGVNWDIRC